MVVLHREDLIVRGGGAEKLLSVIMEAPISENDKKLVEQLYVKYHRLMLYVANQFFCNHAMAEDAMSESLVKIIRYRNKLRDVSSHQTKAYIVNIVRTTSLNLIKQRDFSKHEPEDFMEDIPDESINILSNLVSNEGYESLMKAFQSLPPALRDVAYQHLVLELSHDEIAQMFGISNSASKKRLSRAKIAIKKFLGGDDSGR